MSQVDLHTHTTASDGALAPADLVRRAAAAGVKVLAITDHDSTEGIAEAAPVAADLGISLIPGIELGADKGGVSVHMLVYFPNLADSAFQYRLATMRTARIERARRIVATLDALGMPVDLERVYALADGGAVGRPHVAQALVERGYVETISEAFDKYLYDGGPAYVARDDSIALSPADAVQFGRQAGGLPVLAHPYYLTWRDRTLDQIVADLAAVGLAGIECYYKDHTPEQIAQILDLAQRHDLLVTGGTDFHGTGNLAEFGPGSTDVPWSVAERLYTTAGQPLSA